MSSVRFYRCDLIVICNHLSQLSLFVAALVDPNPQQTSTALGYVASLLLHLSSYVSIPLRYQIHPQLSRSTIRDDISQSHQGAPVFPLFAEGQDRFRYGYGVFLLNKDIEQVCCSSSFAESIALMSWRSDIITVLRSQKLMNYLGLFPSNLRRTLPNLAALVREMAGLGSPKKVATLDRISMNGSAPGSPRRSREA